jgi:hypothetical protein
VYAVVAGLQKRIFMIAKGFTPFSGAKVFVIMKP